MAVAEALLGQAAHTMMAQDALWISDALLSSSGDGNGSGVPPLVLFGHSSRIVYEGALAIRSANPVVGLPSLISLLPDQHGAVISRARHANKLLDDTKKTFRDLLVEMGAYYALHHKAFSGNAVWFARRFETDLGLFEAAGRTLGGTIPLQFRFGVPPTVSISDLGPIVHDVAVEQGSVLALLFKADGTGATATATIDYTPIGPVLSKDRKANRYLDARYDPALAMEAKLLLLMIEGEASTTDVVLPTTERGHREAVFRARIVSLFHVLSAIEAILSEYPSAQSDGARRIRQLMDESATRWFLDDPVVRTLRNRCMHYEIRDKQLALDPNLPMFGMVEAICSGRSFDQVNTESIAVINRVADALGAW